MRRLKYFYLKYMILYWTDPIAKKSKYCFFLARFPHQSFNGLDAASQTVFASQHGQMLLAYGLSSEGDKLLPLSYNKSLVFLAALK